VVIVGTAMVLMVATDLQATRALAVVTLAADGGQQLDAKMIARRELMADMIVGQL